MQQRYIPLSLRKGDKIVTLKINLFRVNIKPNLLLIVINITNKYIGSNMNRIINAANLSFIKHSIQFKFKL